MNHSVAKAQIEASLTSRLGPVFKSGEKRPIDFLSSGLTEIDELTGGGLPRGAITEIVGSMSSGRISVVLRSLVYATTNEETCVIVDTSDTFDPKFAAHAGVELNRLLWVRCRNSVERAFKATDLLLQSGGFGLVVLNLAEVAANYARRIMSSWWFRFRRAIEKTPTAFIVISPVTCVRSCASVILEAKQTNAIWLISAMASQPTVVREPVSHMRKMSLVKTWNRPSPSSSHAHLLNGFEVQVKLIRPYSCGKSSMQFTND